LVVLSKAVTVRSQGLGFVKESLLCTPQFIDFCPKRCIITLQGASTLLQGCNVPA
jgi:hypothetical protein